MLAVWEAIAICIVKRVARGGGLQARCARNERWDVLRDGDKIERTSDKVNRFNLRY
jgi:hypothetical protein